MKIVEQAMQDIRRAISDASAPLSKSDYHALLEELLAEAEGWKMTLQEESEDE